jgi:hypothetical protein
MIQARREVGFVYVLTNPAMPGIVKIGKTSWLSEDRAQKLFTTGVPEPFSVAFRLETSWPDKVERRAHDSLEEHRVHPRREFFGVSTAEAIDAVRIAAVDVGGIAEFEGGQTIHLKRGDRLALTLEKGQTFALMAFPNILSRSAEVIDLWQAHSDGDLLEIIATSSAGHVASFADGHPGGCDDPVPYLDRDENVANGMINGREHLATGDRLLWFAPPTEDHPATHVLFEAGTYCQIISRTWSPVPGPYGRALLLNEWITAPSQEMTEAMRKALALPIPHRWAPRNVADWEGWEPIAVDPQPPEYWLPQLKKRQPKRP